MKKPDEVVALVGQYGALVDEHAQALLTRGPYAMYGMMRYFMGFAGEDLQPTSEVFGGKRFRSGLCLMLADLYGAKDAALPVALSVEVFHNFTLIHDDIVDKDEMRRGRPTVWKLWGTDHAINTGDGQLLIALQALEPLPPEIHLKVQKFLLAKYLEVVEGQFLDFTLTDYALSDPRTTEALYVEMMIKKTSVLVGAATQGAGIVARVDVAEEESLWHFGLSLGLAYQLCDDTVGIWGTAEMTGKKPHGDVRVKKKTLPVLFTATALTGAEQQEFVALYSGAGSMTEDEVQRAITLMNSVGAYAEARKRVEVEKEKALQAVQALSVSAEGKKLLSDLVVALLPPLTI